jgi:hypothetical protein
MTLRTRLVALGVVMGTAVAITAGSTAATAAGGGAQSTVFERLSGYEEVPLALSTTGNGQFRAQIDEEGQKITYRLSYANLEADVTQGHIHFGSPSQAGGISAWLCGTEATPGPEGTPVCPPGSATVSGTLTPEDVVGPAGQGIAAGEFDELIDALRAGSTYVNVHSGKYPAGEVRGHIGHAR